MVYIAFALSFTYFVQRRLSLYFLPPPRTINDKAVKPTLFAKISISGAQKCHSRYVRPYRSPLALLMVAWKLISQRYGSYGLDK